MLHPPLSARHVNKTGLWPFSLARAKKNYFPIIVGGFIKDGHPPASPFSVGHVRARHSCAGSCSLTAAHVIICPLLFAVLVVVGWLFLPADNASWATLHDRGILSILVQGLNKNSIHLQSSRRVVFLVVVVVVVVMVVVIFIWGQPHC